MVQSIGAYNVTSNGKTYALNLCQDINPVNNNYLNGCEQSVFCELGGGSNGSGLPLFSTTNSTGLHFQDQILKIDYITNLQLHISVSTLLYTTSHFGYLMYS